MGSVFLFFAFSHKTQLRRSAFVRCAAKLPHSYILHCACRSLLTENNGKNNTTAVGVYALFCCFFMVKQRTTFVVYAQPHTSLCMRFNVCSPLFRYQETTKTAHSPTVVALCLSLFSVNNDLHA